MSFFDSIDKDIFSNTLNQSTENILYPVINKNDIQTVDDFTSFICYHSKIYDLIKLYFIEKDNILLSLNECCTNAINKFLDNNKNDSLYSYTTVDNVIHSIYITPHDTNKHGISMYISFDFHEYSKYHIILNINIINSTNNNKLSVSPVVLYYTAFDENKKLTPEYINNIIYNKIYAEIDNYIKFYNEFCSFNLNDMVNTFIL